MILSGKEIAKQVSAGRITIDPFDEDRVNPNSYNYRLGIWYAVVDVEESVRQKARDNDLRRIPEEGLCLDPGKVYLCCTKEVIGSNLFVPMLIGRSSVGRLGLFVELSAEMGNLGPAHQWTLEMTAVQPIIVYPGMLIGQVSFWVPDGRIVEYDGVYTRYNVPRRSFVGRLWGDES